MKERPIIFSGEMVRAILEGRKTQARRVVKPQPAQNAHGLWIWSCRGNGGQLSEDFFKQIIPQHCPYGQPGDRLWVRETWGYDCDRDLAFRADGEMPEVNRWRPSIHMPRWASRILLEVTDVRVERVQDISDEDALAEGVQMVKGTKDIDTGYRSADGTCLFDSATNAFWTIWDSINAKRGHGWEGNPWVWVVSFKVLEKG